MMSDLMPFHFDDHPVRIDVDDQGNPWWVAKDVCEILGITNISNAVGRLDTDEKSIRSTDNALIVNEFGLYSLVLKSRKKKAKEFQRWVTHDVIPQIRKTGKYELQPSHVQVKNPVHQLLIDTVVRLDAVEQQAIEARADADAAQRAAALAQANAERALENQLFFTVAEYIHFYKLRSQLPESDYKAASDHLRLYCMDHNIPFRKIQVGGKQWRDEYAFHESVYQDALMGWIKRRDAPALLHVIHTSAHREE